MSRIVARPEALLDGAPIPSDLLDPASDAARYMREAYVFPKMFIELLNDIPYLSNPEAIRLGGSVGSPDIQGRSMMTIPGEPVQSGRRRFFSTADTASREARIRYGFDVIPDPSIESKTDLEPEDEEEKDQGELVEVYVGGKKVSSYREKTILTGGYAEEKLIRVSRLSGNEDEETLLQTLGIVGIGSSGRPTFFTPGVLDDPKAYNHSMDNPGQRIELAQMIAAATDAAEWAFD